MKYLNTGFLRFVALLYQHKYITNRLKQLLEKKKLKFHLILNLGTNLNDNIRICSFPHTESENP